MLDGAVVPLLTLPGLDVMVGVLGFASRTGEDAANATLSEKRAAEVDKYLRRKAPSGVIFFKSGGWGEKQQVSKNPAYHDVWPLLESLDEDERDRSVGIQINWQPVGIIDDLNQPNIDWNKAFERAATRAGLMYALGAFIKVTADYAPSPKVKGVPSPWNPVTGWPNSWTNDRPDGWKVMDAMRPEIISDIELSVKRMGLKITRAADRRALRRVAEEPDQHVGAADQIRPGLTGKSFDAAELLSGLERDRRVQMGRGRSAPRC